MRVHFTVTRARMQLLSLWMERSLPALCLHAKIVVAGRGLDLRNLTANDRENIRQMELQYAEYRYVPPPSSSDKADGGGGGEECGFEPDPPPAGPGKGRSGTFTGPSSMSLVKEMHTVQFHAFLRAHHDLIVSSTFLTEIAPIVQATPPQFLTAQIPAHAAPHKEKYRPTLVQTVASLRYAALFGLVVKNRRTYMQKANKKTAVEFKKFVLTIDDARSLIRDGRDSLCEHLLETGLREAVHAGMRVRQLMGGRRLGVGLGITNASGGNSRVDSRRTSVTPSATNTNTGSTDASGLLQREKSFRGPGALQKEKSFRGPGSLQKDGSFRGPGSLQKEGSFRGSPPGLQKEGSFRSTGKSEKVRTNMIPGSSAESSISLPKEGSFRSTTGKSEKVRSSTSTSTSTSASKSRAKAKILAVTATASSVPTALLLSRMPLPPVFLLLRSVTAEDMALLYFEVADQTRRLHAGTADTKGRRKASVVGRLSNSGPYRPTLVPNMDGSLNVHHAPSSHHRPHEPHPPHTLAPQHTTQHTSSHHVHRPSISAPPGHLQSAIAHTLHTVNVHQSLSHGPHPIHNPHQQNKPHTPTSSHHSSAAMASPMHRRIK